VAQLGEPREVYEAPADRYVAEFIGNVNIFEGTVADPAQGLITIADGAPPVRAGRTLTVGKGAPIAVALRPEKMVLDKLSDAAPASENAIDGVVEDIAYLGDISIYRVRLANGGMAKVARTNRVRLQGQNVLWEDPVRLSWDAQAVVPLTS
jgi:putrescine transport system ATP-binding protein